MFAVGRLIVPEGLDDGSQAVHCLGSVRKRARPVRDGLSKSDQTYLCIPCGKQSCIAGPTAPSYRGRGRRRGRLRLRNLIDGSPGCLAP
jgi:hypothetical protein